MSVSCSTLGISILRNNKNGMFQLTSLQPLLVVGCHKPEIYFMCCFYGKVKNERRDYLSGFLKEAILRGKNEVTLAIVKEGVK